MNASKIEAEADPSPSGSTAQRPVQDIDDLGTFVEQMLSNMQGQFEEMSRSVLSKINGMGQRLDDLERTIEGLIESTSDNSAQSSDPANGRQRSARD
ncbi:heat shock factor binding protein 1-domain-containing protein [Polychytrium aggregatum]|uniref:heat shock factor binding protein 1-domain-containing protein n=1 Tax=Polychytrium aggregatum TaxID=110093 RepID=UPI0022FF3ABA|nr:heat shock factor binding protein 1-domain-containing protein [Polychytrium aggregatum]KAI9199414.1 heat shock factor binding protein 1-domain-containing protein [Polychytrium aggregatum]